MPRTEVGWRGIGGRQIANAENSRTSRRALEKRSAFGTSGPLERVPGTNHASYVLHRPQLRDLAADLPVRRFPRQFASTRPERRTRPVPLSSNGLGVWFGTAGGARHMDI